MADTQKLFNENTRDKYYDWFVKKIYNDMLINTENYEQISPGVFRFLMFQIFCYFKFFDHDLPDDHDENYYFEREWRIVGNLKFTLNDIKRIIISEDHAKQFRNDIPDYCGQLSFI